MNHSIGFLVLVGLLAVLMIGTAGPVAATMEPLQ